MTSMREKIARKLAAITINDWGEVERAGRAIGQIVDQQWPSWLDDADAVLDVLADPTKAMVDAGIRAADDCKDTDWDSGPDGEGYNTYERLRSDAPIVIFKAMLAAANEEE